MPFAGAAMGIMQGISAKKEAKRKAADAEVNAVNEDALAKRDELALGINQKVVTANRLLEMEDEETLGIANESQTVADMGASGVVIEGTFSDVLRSETMKTQAKVNQRGTKGLAQYAEVSNKGAMAIHEHRMNAINYRNQAQQFKAQGRTALFGSLMGAAMSYGALGGDVGATP